MLAAWTGALSVLACIVLPAASGVPSQYNLARQLFWLLLANAWGVAGGFRTFQSQLL